MPKEKVQIEYTFEQLESIRSWILSIKLWADKRTGYYKEHFPLLKSVLNQINNSS